MATRHPLLACLGLALGLWAGSVAASPPGDEDRAIRQSMEYQGIAGVGYERYPRFPLNRPVYDRIGSYVGHGQFLMRWDEIRERYIEDKLEAGQSILDTKAQSILYEDDSITSFGNLTMVQQDMQGKGSAFFMGRGPITSFSSLVLYKIDYAGTRADYSLPGHDFSFILSRGGLHGRVFSSFLGTSSGTVDNSPVLVYGGNWRGSFGPLQVGTTVLRQIQSDLRGDQETLFRGDVPYRDLQQPHRVMVRFEDDDTRDAGGMAVFEAVIFVRSSEDGEVYTNSRDAADATYSAALEPVVTGRAVGDHWEAVGEGEAVDFTFEIDADLPTESVEIVAAVSGDYKIGIRQNHMFSNTRSGTESEVSWPTPPSPSSQYASDFKDIPYTPEPFYTVRRAEGAPDVGERRVVRFRHQIPTGQSFYSANLRVRAKGVEIDAEYALNPQEFIFPKRGGSRQRKTSQAGFLRARRDLSSWGALGAEWFRLEPTYGGWYDSRRGGCVFFSDVAGEASSGEEANIESATQEFPLYDDNDDHDTWADDFIGDFPNFPAGQFGSTEAPKGSIALGAGAMESGVYPGLDMNRDFIYDMDVNRNAVGDWFEPLFAYDVDPPSFIYDIDFNNNGVADSRENDNEPDYPYKRDQQGVHLYYDFARKPSWLDQLALGWQRSEQIAGHGESSALYARAQAHASLGGLNLRLADDVKRVEDDIPDDVYWFVLTTDLDLFKRYNTARFAPPPDPLIMRDSFVNTAFLETEYTPVRGLQVVNTFKHVLNSQAEIEDETGGMLQESGTLHNLTMVNKVQYTVQPVADLTVRGRLKHLLAKWDAGSYNYRTVVASADDTLRGNPDESWSMLTPSLMARYRLTPHTRIEWGQAGLFLPALRARYTDREHPERSYTSNLSVLQLTITSTHQGYLMTTNVGVRKERTEFDEDSGLPKDSYSAFFVDVVLGLE